LYNHAGIGTPLSSPRGTGGFMSRIWLISASLWLASLQWAAAQPVRKFDDKGAPPFKVLKEGENPPLDAYDNFVIGPKYSVAPERKKADGVPEGKVVQFEFDSKETKLFNPGIARKVFGKVDPNNPKTLIVETHTIDYKRRVGVYIPAGYKEGTLAPFMVVHDGPGQAGGFKTILDNLIAQKRIPPIVLISISNGGGDAQGHERGKEYDNMNGDYATYIEDEVLPRVEKNAMVKLTKDPDGRAAMGNSSGGSAALIMAWFRNDLYHRVLTTSGTFVNQAWPFDPKYPDGAWGFHKTLIPSEPKKPIRLFISVGDKDLLNPNVMRDEMHDWVEANNQMAKVLKAKGYEYQYLYCQGSGHSVGNAQQQFLPHAIEWVWKGYGKEKVK
jgi:enterochelin esterase-like enzyme